MGEGEAGQPLVDAADGRRKDQGADLETGPRSGPPDGDISPILGFSGKEPYRNLLQKQRLVAAVGLGDLDGGTRLDPALSQSDVRDDRSDPRAQRGEADIHWQARRVRNHGAGDSRRYPADYPPSVAED